MTGGRGIVVSQEGCTFPSSRPTSSVTRIWPGCCSSTRAPPRYAPRGSALLPSPRRCRGGRGEGAQPGGRPGGGGSYVRRARAAALHPSRRARLRDGREVAVKVQRPGVQDAVRLDMEVLQDVATLADEFTEAGRKYAFSALLEEFRKALTAELDYRQEAENLAAFANILEGFDRIVVPRPVTGYTTMRVLTMEFVCGPRARCWTSKTSCRSSLDVWDGCWTRSRAATSRYGCASWTTRRFSPPPAPARQPRDHRPGAGCGDRGRRAHDEHRDPTHALRR